MEEYEDVVEVVEEDSEGNSLLHVLTLERKSVKPFRSQDEYLYAMKEDLGEWFNTLYGSDMDVTDFFEQLETGVLLCQHANNVNGYIVGHASDDSLLQDRASQVIQCRSNGVKPGSFHSRDNLSNFIHWCRWTLDMPDTLLFESDDLVMRKNERNFILCLLEVARRGARYGMLAPVLIQLEVEIDAEIAREEEEEEEAPPSPPSPTPERQPSPPPQRPRRTIDMMSLDELVREIAKLCTCPDQFPIIRVSEGKYKVGESLTLIFVRILRNHVMVRIGGGWDTLQNYLNRHDPCRCHANKAIGHASRRFAKVGSNSNVTPVKRRDSMSSPVPAHRQLPSTPGDTTPRCSSAKVRRNSSNTSQHSVERVRQSSDESRSNRPQTPTRGLKRAQSPLPNNTPPRPQSPAAHLHPKSPITPRKVVSSGYGRERRDSTSTDSRQDPIIHPQPKRPASATPGHSRTVSRDQGPVRSRSRERSPADSSHARSRSVGAEEMRKHMIKSASMGSYDCSNKEVFMVKRDKSGRHIVNISEGENNKVVRPTPVKATAAAAGGFSERTLGANRVRIAPGNILPNKPKTIMRSYSGENNGAQENGSNVSSPNSDTLEPRPVFKRQSSHSSNGSMEDLLDLPAPKADRNLNKQMEQLFEQYRNAEKGWFKCDMDSNDNVTFYVGDTPRPTSASQRPKSAIKSQKPQEPPPIPSRKSSTSSSSSSLASSGGRMRPTTPTRRPVTPRREAPATPTTQRRAVTPVRPVPVRPVPVRPVPVHPGQQAPEQDQTPGRTSQAVSRTSSFNVNRARSKTPTPESNTPRVRPQPRPNTPLISCRTEEVKPRTDSGLRKRPTTPNSEFSTPQRREVTRSSSVGRTVINNAMNGGAPGLSRPKSRSREDILDSDNGERRSRTDTTRNRDGVQTPQSKPRRALPPTPDTFDPEPPTEDIPVTPQVVAKPRKDECRIGPDTRIPGPRPSSARGLRSPTPESGCLKRFDSGVDINISPTENGSSHGDDDSYPPWSAPEAVTLAPQAYAYPMSIATESDDYY